MKFTLSDNLATLAHVNIRSEMIGEQQVPACDLKFRINLPNDALAAFDPALKDALYHYDPSAGDLADHGRAGDPEYKPHLRFPNLSTPIRWAVGVVDSCDVRVSLGAGSVALLDCRVNNFALEPLDGGTVTIEFRVQCHPDAHGIGVLGTWVQNDVQVTVTPQEPKGVSA